MDIVQDWNRIRKWMKPSFPCYFMATADADGMPNAAPVASLLLGAPGEGVFFDIFTIGMRRNLDENPRLVFLMLRTGRWFWLRAFWRGRFDDPPAFRLVGRAGPRRASTEEERQRWRRKVGPLRFFKGHDMLWGKLEYVREVRFERVETIKVGRMYSDPSESERA